MKKIELVKKEITGALKKKESKTIIIRFTDPKDLKSAKEKLKDFIKSLKIGLSPSASMGELSTKQFTSSWEDCLEIVVQGIGFAKPGKTQVFIV